MIVEGGRGVSKPDGRDSDPRLVRKALAHGAARASAGSSQRLRPVARGKRATPRQARGAAAAPTILNSLDMSQTSRRRRSRTNSRRLQGRLNLLQRKAQNKGISTILVFEGWDAAGKGGAIRRDDGALDARSYQVIPIAAPTDEERAHHYLWRFWRHLSRAGA